MSGLDEAPYLTEYYETVLRITEKRIPKGVAGYRTMDDDFRAKLQDEIETAARPWLIKSFDHHDRDSTGTLDKEEASRFFKHMMDKAEPFLKKGAYLIELSVMSQMKSMFQYASLEVWKEAEEQFEDKFQKIMAEMTPRIEDMVDDYYRNRDERDLAAFKVADVDGDGTLDKWEFLDCVVPDAKRYHDFMKELGFDKEAIDRDIEKALDEALGELVRRR